MYELNELKFLADVYKALGVVADGLSAAAWRNAIVEALQIRATEERRKGGTDVSREEIQAAIDAGRDTYPPTHEPVYLFTNAERALADLERELEEARQERDDAIRHGNEDRERWFEECATWKRRFFEEKEAYASLRAYIQTLEEEIQT